MSARENFDDALDAAIDQIRAGEPLSDVLAAHSRHADALRPLLETSLQADASARATTAPLPSGLADNFTIVRAALERERMSVAASRAPVINQNTPWWARRWTVASLSLPVGVVLFLLAGAGGAAAATVAVTNSDVATSVVSLVTPEWAEDLVPSALQEKHGEDGARPNGAGAPTAVVASDSPGGSETPHGAGGETSTVEVTIEGTIADVQGNTFTLVSASDDWKVQTDAKTIVSGEIIEGASATVTGAQTGGKTVHADEVSTDNNGAAPGTENGNPSQDKTPPGQQNGGSNDGPNGNESPAVPPGNGNGPGENSSGGNNNGNGPGENSSGGNNNAGGSESSNTGQGASGGNSPPGQANSPSGGGDGQGNGNASGSGNSGGGNGPGADSSQSSKKDETKTNNGNDGAPKKP